MQPLSWQTKKMFCLNQEKETEVSSAHIYRHIMAANKSMSIWRDLKLCQENGSNMIHLVKPCYLKVFLSSCNIIHLI
jgi:hypothetical protein